MSEIKEQIWAGGVVIGDAFLVDKHNADEWACVIGKPLAEAIKNQNETEPRKCIVTAVDTKNKVITVQGVE